MDQQVLMNVLSTTKISEDDLLRAASEYALQRERASLTEKMQQLEVEELKQQALQRFRTRPEFEALTRFLDAQIHSIRLEINQLCTAPAQSRLAALLLGNGAREQVIQFLSAQIQSHNELRVKIHALLAECVPAGKRGRETDDEDDDDDWCNCRKDGPCGPRCKCIRAGRQCEDRCRCDHEACAAEPRPPPRAWHRPKVSHPPAPAAPAAPAARPPLLK